MKKILLIDDDDTYLWCMKSYLAKLGYHAETATTVAEAKELLKQIAPLFVCSDLRFPDGSGLEILDIVQADNPDIPFLIASCLEKEDYEQEAIKHGATLCMDKMNTALVFEKLLEYSRSQ